MGCSSSSPAADEPPFAARAVSPRHVAGRDRDARGTMHFGPAPGQAAPPPPPPPSPPPGSDEERGEKVSAKTLERLRSTFLSTASRGSVYDNYTLGHTLGAPRAACVRVRVRTCFPFRGGGAVGASVPRSRAAAARLRRPACDGAARRGEQRTAAARRRGAAPRRGCRELPRRAATSARVSPKRGFSARAHGAAAPPRAAPLARRARRHAAACAHCAGGTRAARFRRR
jgi:hypothetical protein